MLFCFWLAAAWHSQPMKCMLCAAFMMLSQELAWDATLAWKVTELASAWNNPKAACRLMLQQIQFNAVFKRHGLPERDSLLACRQGLFCGSCGFCIEEPADIVGVGNVIKLGRDLHVLRRSGWRCSCVLLSRTDGTIPLQESTSAFRLEKTLSAKGQTTGQSSLDHNTAWSLPRLPTQPDVRQAGTFFCAWYVDQSCEARQNAADRVGRTGVGRAVLRRSVAFCEWAGKSPCSRLLAVHTLSMPQPQQHFGSDAGCDKFWPDLVHDLGQVPATLALLSYPVSLPFEVQWGKDRTMGAVRNWAHRVLFQLIGKEVLTSLRGRIL